MDVKPGDRIVLIDMLDDPNPVEPGTEGTVEFIDGMGDIHVDWDDGRTLALIPEVDRFRVIGSRIAGVREDLRIDVGGGDIIVYAPGYYDHFYGECVLTLQESDGDEWFWERSGKPNGAGATGGYTIAPPEVDDLGNGTSMSLSEVPSPVADWIVSVWNTATKTGSVRTEGDSMRKRADRSWIGINDFDSCSEYLSLGHVDGGTYAQLFLGGAEVKLPEYGVMVMVSGAEVDYPYTLSFDSGYYGVDFEQGEDTHEASLWVFDIDADDFIYNGKVSGSGGGFEGLLADIENTVFEAIDGR